MTDYASPLASRYIGAVEMQRDMMCVYDEGQGFVTREVGYVPGLFKIFDEILGQFFLLFAHQGYSTISYPTHTLTQSQSMLRTTSSATPR